MEQSALNWVFGVANIILGAALKWIYDAHRDLRKADERLTEKVNKIEVVVAGEYVKREEFDRVADVIFTKLDKIYEKLDTKADK
jgi:hypothetical protein